MVIAGGRRYEWPGGTPRTEVNCTETYCIYDKIWCVEFPHCECPAHCVCLAPKRGKFLTYKGSISFGIWLPFVCPEIDCLLAACRYNAGRFYLLVDGPHEVVRLVPCIPNVPKPSPQHPYTHTHHTYDEQSISMSDCVMKHTFEILFTTPQRSTANHKTLTSSPRPHHTIYLYVQVASQM